jgi:hypothetical protein
MRGEVEVLKEVSIEDNSASSVSISSKVTTSGRMKYSEKSSIVNSQNRKSP